MAEFSLPRNSKVRKDGRVFKAPAGAKHACGCSRSIVTTRIRREPSPRYLRSRHGQLRADGVGRPHQDQERDRSTLSFRRSCREGICGSCAMNIDGKNGLACISACADVKSDIKIYPLPHMPVIKDLVPDLTNFYAQYAAISRGCRVARPRRRTASGCNRRKTRKRSTGRRRASCAPAARPAARATGGTASATLGPAALLAAYRWIVDSRDEAQGERLDSSRIPSGCIAATPS
jgi:succinate dehydrogenase / fumarate reductase iron-sulfur subunit